MISPYAELRRGLVGAWCPSLGGSGYTLTDRSPYNRHGTLTNMGGQIAWAGTQGGVALQFDGSNDRVELPSSITIVSGTPFTVSFWAWTNNLTTQAYPHFLTLRTTSGTGPFEISASAQGTYNGILWGSSDGIWIRGRVDINWTSGAWNHICFVYNGNAANSLASYAVYLNGALQANTITGPFATVTNSTVLGGVAGGGSSNFLFGYLDDVRLWDRAISQSGASILASRRGIGLTPQRTRRVNTLGSQFWLRDSGTWKRATPWIKVNGVWTKATPKLNVTGTWK